MKRLLALFMMVLPLIANAFTGKVEIDGIYYNLTTKANVAEVTAGDTPYSEEIINIPESVEYEGTICYVTSIGDKAFRNCTKLKNIYIPSGVTIIGESAFYGCASLEDIRIPENVTTIKGSAFVNCTSLKTVSFPASLTSMRTAFDQNTSIESVYISDLAAWCKLDFWMARNNPLNYAKHLYVNGEELTDLVIPESLTVIGNAFWGFNGLKTLVIPEGITEIGACAFGNCENLTSVSIANTVTKIDYYAFRGCTSLKEVRIPNSVTYIGEQDFKDCTELKTVIIGEGLDFLGGYSFSGCTELTDVYVYTKDLPKTYYEEAFSNSDIKYAKLHVRESLIPSFKRDAPWKNFGSIVKVPEIIYMVDGEIYDKDAVIIGTPVTAIEEPTKEGHTFSGWSEIPETMPNEDVTVSGSFSVNSYLLSYYVDGELYKECEVKYGTSITPETEPTKKGYTFSGWKNIPSIMPAKDVVVNGSFTINKYKLTYYVDNNKYKETEINYNSEIVPEENPIKEGHTFSGWSEIPELMPDHDVDVSGSFTVNDYKVTFISEGSIIKEEILAFATTISIPESPEKIGHTFTGWNPTVDATVPAHDVTYTAQFSVNQYTITFNTDGGTEIAPITQDYGTSITKPEDPTKEGYTFTGWNAEIPEIMPAENLTIKATWAINAYKLTYILDGNIYKEYTLDYKSTITPEVEPTKEGYTFSGWSEIPSTMPAHDVEINGSFEVNTYKVSYFVENDLVHVDEVEFEKAFDLWTYVPEGDDITFNGWIGELYDTMPAHDITYRADITSGIAYIYNNAENISGIFTLGGRKVEKMDKGVYIVKMKNGNTRKVVNK